MSWKNGFLLAILTSSMASVMCIIYNSIYNYAFLTDFSRIINSTSMLSACSFASFAMTLGYILLSKIKDEDAIIWLNPIYIIISFGSIAGVLFYSLPLDIEFPEMFPGLAIPMLFFPVLSLLTIYPIYKKIVDK